MDQSWESQASPGLNSGNDSKTCISGINILLLVGCERPRHFWGVETESVTDDGYQEMTDPNLIFSNRMKNLFETLRHAVYSNILNYYLFSSIQHVVRTCSDYWEGMKK